MAPVTLPVRATGLPLEAIYQGANLGFGAQQDAYNTALGFMQEDRGNRELQARGQEMQKPMVIQEVQLPDGTVANQATFQNPDGSFRNEIIPGQIPQSTPAPYRTIQTVMRNGVPTHVMFEMGPGGMREVPLGSAPPPQAPQPPAPIPMWGQGATPETEMPFLVDRSGNAKPVQGITRTKNTSTSTPDIGNQFLDEDKIRGEIAKRMLTRLSEDLSVPPEQRQKLKSALDLAGLERGGIDPTLAYSLLPASSQSLVDENTRNIMSKFKANPQGTNLMTSISELVNKDQVATGTVDAAESLAQELLK